MIFCGDFLGFFLSSQRRVRSLGGGVLGDGLGALRDGVLGELTGEDEANSGLDLAGGDGGPLVVGGELGGLVGDPLKDVVDERVHDGHGLVGDTSVGVNLLENLENVRGVRLLALGVPALLLSALLSSGSGLGGLGGLGGGLSGGLLLSGLLLGLRGHCWW